MSEGNFVQPSIPKFDGHYDHWSMLMENFFRSKEYWSLIEQGVPTAVEGAPLTETQMKVIQDQKLKDLKAKNYLFQAIDRSLLETILKKDSAKDIWDSLKQKYQGTARVKRAQLQALRKEWEILQMKVGESVNDYFARTLTIANKKRIHGEQMNDVVVIEKILRSMTPKFDYVVCAIEESNNVEVMFIDELQSSLLVHEQRMNYHTVAEEHALKITYEANFEGRGRGRGVYRGRGRGRHRPSFDKSTVECYNCHDLGHFQYECPKKGLRANFADTSEEMLLMAYVEEQQISTAEVWFLDSGCSNHMCGKKELFSDLDETFRETVKLGNNSCMTVMGKGNIRIRVNENTQVFTGVFYVPELKSNLLSIGQLQEKGLAILIKNGKCKVYHPNRGLIIEIKMSSNRMFVLLDQRPSEEQICYSSLTDDSAGIWHRRYGHLSYDGLKTLQQKNMVQGLPHIKPPVILCEECMLGKQARDPFPKSSTWRATRILQLVHSDICGPIKPISNSNKRYFISFIDDFSRKVWVYFLTEKSEAFYTFKRFKNLVEKETGVYLSGLRTDRGGEFTSNEFNNFCNEHGIRRQLTAAYTPQQNGVAERKNRTIMNMVRSMLNEKKFPKNFWPEAVNWSVHLLNRSPTLAVKNVTPEEAWSHIKPSVSYFRIFGCTAYVHIPDVKRTKLDNKSLKCVFLGVSGEAKAYRLFDPLSKTIIISRDVKFEEDGHWDWDHGYAEAVMADLDWDDVHVHALDSHGDNAILESDSDVAATSTHPINTHEGVEVAAADEATAEESVPESRVNAGRSDAGKSVHGGVHVESSVNAGRRVHSGVHAETILPTATESSTEEGRV